MPDKMKAVVRHTYGPDDVRVEHVDKPEPADNEVLVKVHAASLNRLDWYTMTGTPYIGRPQFGFRKPRDPRLGVDFAGTVEAVGRGVETLQPGDEVFGARDGALAEYVTRTVEKGVAQKPAGLTFEEAAALPIAGGTALLGLRDKAQVQPGQKVLVNGASGGVGTFAVQIAKALGADVTAVCSTRNVETARSLGADHVIDYTREDFTRGVERYDVLFDNAGSRSWSACKRVLKPGAIVVLVGGPKKNRLLGPVGHMIGMRLGSVRSSQSAAFLLSNTNTDTLTAVAELVVTGKVKPLVERVYELSQAGDALRYVGEGHAQGKVVVTL